MAYTTNKFCWHGLMTPDTAKAAAFYPEVLGWKSETMEMGGEESLMFVANDVPLAHFRVPPMEGTPAHWANYLRVDDVNASHKAALANGGNEIAPPTDIPPGRFSVVTTPSGAAMCLFHEADENMAAHHPGGTGSVHWVELHSQDIDKDLEWLKGTFGYDVQDSPIPNGTYHLLKVGDEQRAGAMKAMMDGVPSAWVAWFEVDDCDAAMKRVEGNGGKALSPAMDMDGVGRMAMVMDNQGAAFGIIAPAR